MKKNIKYLLAVIFALSAIAFAETGPARVAWAQSSLWQAQEGLGSADNPIGDVYGSETPSDPRVIAARIVKIFLGFIGIILLIILIVAGFRWMTSGGNQEAVSKAKSQITSAIIGLIIILAAYALADFIATELADKINSE